MPGITYPNLGLIAGFPLGEDGWADEMTANVKLLSIIGQGRALDKVAALPGAPVDGDVVILDETAVANANDIAAYIVDTWEYFTPLEGWLIYNIAAGYYEQFDGALWAELETGGAAALADLTDVDITTTPPADGETLVWDDVNNKFKPGAASGGGGAADPAIGVTLERSADSGSTSGEYEAAWASAITEDVSTFWDAGAPANIVIPKAGWYAMSFTITDTNSGAARVAVARLKVNGTVVFEQTQFMTNAFSPITITLAHSLKLAANDIVKFAVQVYGGATSYTTGKASVVRLSDGGSAAVMATVVDAAYSVLGTENFVLFDRATAQVVTLPAATAQGFQFSGIQRGVGQVSFAAGAGATILSPGGLLDLRLQYSSFTATKISATEWSLAGDLA